MADTTNQEIHLSKNEKIGIIIGLAGLVANILTLGIFDFSPIKLTSTESPTITALWVSIMTTIPLLYSWGYFAWLVNSKYKKIIDSVIFTGIILLPFYISWGIMVLSEGVQAYYYDLPHFVNFRYLSLSEVARSRIEGGLIAIPLQITIGVVLSFVLMLWNRLIAQDKNNQNTQPLTTLVTEQQTIKPDKKKPSTTPVPSKKKKILKEKK